MGHSSSFSSATSTAKCTSDYILITINNTAGHTVAHADGFFGFLSKLLKQQKMKSELQK